MLKAFSIDKVHMTADNQKTGVIELTVGGQRIALEMQISPEPVKPQRVLPIFQQMTDEFVRVGTEAAEADGKKIACTMGCGACCRQPVPISELEVYKLAELVEALPEPRRTEIKGRFAAARAHFEDLGWFERLAELSRRHNAQNTDEVAVELQEFVEEYFHEWISCPFLENEACSIYSMRPLVCREYLVTSPAENCLRQDNKPIIAVDLPMKPSKNVQFIFRSGRMNKFGLIPLIRALELAEEMPEEFEKRKGEEWLGEFFDKLEEIYSGNPSAAPIGTSGSEAASNV